ncbi:MAG: nucleotidyltransferase domain-containing protein [Bacteroidales bacterium]|nr:nucleotidyltransferase domain-containing protein [Bacteroidales bacterium]
MGIDERNIVKIRDLCIEHKVKELYLFGSYVTDNYNKDSDIDFLVEFEGVDLLDYFNNYMNFKESLESTLEKDIDLVENNAIKNPIFRKSVDRNKRLIYERESS